MSTFDGIITEFPDIRVDFFRSHSTLRPPLACFLSHIHSDHLAGLETLKSPFVYCSAATKELLIRLERYPCRINYAKGIIEARMQTYKSLSLLLKPLPLETPAELEISPGKKIRVTLFDANHCPGSVMFSKVFEREDTAVLYTGDIRCEPWYVNDLMRNPCLIEYTSGIKTLDKIYLDTSNIEDIHFQTKAEGLQELLRKVSKYPADTIFFLQAWTYGYEDVWIALAKALNTKIHVDDYKLGLYRSLVVKDSLSKYGRQVHLSPEAPALVGFMCGNNDHPGCLTDDQRVRLHSCEKGTYCKTMQESPVVWISPIVAHLPNGYDITEVGIGGGGDDLEREAELDGFSADEAQTLIETVFQSDGIADALKDKIRSFLLQTFASGRNVSLNLDVSSFNKDNETNLVKAVESVARKAQLGKGKEKTADDTDPLPKRISFPYSRHASYHELCLLVEAFRPKDVWPCTSNDVDWIKNAITIQDLFGKHCSSDVFAYDRKLAALAEKIQEAKGDHDDTQSTTSTESETNGPDSPVAHPSSDGPVISQEVIIDLTNIESDDSEEDQLPTPRSNSRKRSIGQFNEADGLDNEPGRDDSHLLDSQTSEISERALEIRRTAFNSMIENARDHEWHPIPLISTWDNHTEEEQEL